MQVSKHTPIALNLHQKSRILVIEFDDGQRFELPCEYLRVFSKAAEVRTMDKPVIGKETVNITAIEPQGNYAIRLLFDDGHDTGIYSWDSLYQLGINREHNWQEYLERLQNIGYQRQEDTGTRQIRVLYFAYLAQKLRQEVEHIELPEQVVDVAALLGWLSQRKPAAAPLFSIDKVRVTVNHQFAEHFTRIDNGDEIAIVPNSPISPPTPDLV